MSFLLFYVRGDERAVLLERLSGTQKYSVVGQRVYSGYKAKLNDVEAFKASMDAVDILDEQQLQELNEQQHQYIEQQQQCQKRREQVAKHLQWFTLSNNYNMKSQTFNSVYKLRVTA